MMRTKQHDATELQHLTQHLASFALRLDGAHVRAGRTSFSRHLRQQTVGSAARWSFLLPLIGVRKGHGEPLGLAASRGSRSWTSLSRSFSSSSSSVRRATFTHMTRGGRLGQVLFRAALQSATYGTRRCTAWRPASQHFLEMLLQKESRSGSPRIGCPRQRTARFHAVQGINNPRLS